MATGEEAGGVFWRIHGLKIATEFEQGAADFEPRRDVELQEIHRRTTGRGDSENLRVLLPKMSGPKRTAWVKERGQIPAGRINRCDVRAFVPITMETGKGQIL